MLTLTDQAQTVVRALTQDPQAPESAGLRIAPGSEGLELLVVAEPVPGDALIDDGGVRVFVEPQAAKLLDDQTLDAQVEDGEVNFYLASPDVVSSRQSDSDQTQVGDVVQGSQIVPE